MEDSSPQDQDSEKLKILPGDEAVTALRLRITGGMCCSDRTQNTMAFFDSN